jgi:hypothetical protein
MPTLGSTFMPTMPKGVPAPFSAKPDKLEPSVTTKRIGKPWTRPVRPGYNMTEQEVYDDYRTDS